MNKLKSILESGFLKSSTTEKLTN